MAATTPLDKARYQRALDDLFGRLNYERTPEAARSIRDFRLTQMQQLLEELGNPQNRIPTVHIAGSKGKGSTATMVASIVQAAGYRVGLFTSPHLIRFEERFTVNGVEASHREVADLFDQVNAASQRLQNRTQEPSPPHTYFELATAMGWLHFLNNQVDLAVMEVGLGGRLDSTNVCSPLVTAITSISLDHTRLLGETLELIAKEKGGIIKPGVPVVTNVADPAAFGAIEAIAQEKSASQFQLGRDFHYVSIPPASGASPRLPNYRFDFQGLGTTLHNLQLNLPGEHQCQNGALATAIAILLRQNSFDITESAIRQGLASARCPLRIEVLSEQPLIIVDVAHNPASIKALCETLQQVPAQRRITIFASSRDKAADEMLRILGQTMDEIWITRFSSNPRAVDLDELARHAERTLTTPWRIFPDGKSALAAAMEESRPGDMYCVTGSFFLAGEVKAILKPTE